MLIENTGSYWRRFFADRSVARQGRGGLLRLQQRAAFAAGWWRARARSFLPVKGFFTGRFEMVAVYNTPKEGVMYPARAGLRLEFIGEAVSTNTAVVARRSYEL